jgi:acyl dehydratase
MTWQLQRSRYGGLIVSGTHTTALLLGLAAAHFSRNFFSRRNFFLG